VRKRAGLKKNQDQTKRIRRSCSRKPRRHPQQGTRRGRVLAVAAYGKLGKPARSVFDLMLAPTRISEDGAYMLRSIPHGDRGIRRSRAGFPVAQLIGPGPRHRERSTASAPG